MSDTQKSKDNTNKGITNLSDTDNKDEQMTLSNDDLDDVLASVDKVDDNADTKEELDNSDASEGDSLNLEESDNTNEENNSEDNTDEDYQMDDDSDYESEDKDNGDEDYDDSVYDEINHTKRKKIIAAGVAVAAVAAITATTVLTNNSNPIQVKASETTVELGDKVVVSKDKLLDKNKMSKKAFNKTDVESVLTDGKNYRYDEKTGKVVTKDGKYVGVGTYTVNFTYENSRRAVKIKVQDTKKPDFIGFHNVVTVEKDAQGFDLKNYYLAEDKSDVKLSANTPAITKAEEVKTNISATDKYNNTDAKQLRVKVVTQDDIKKGAKLTPMVNGSVPLSKDTMAKAKNGEIKINVEDQNDAIAKQMNNIKDNKLEGTSSYKTISDGQYLNQSEIAASGNVVNKDTLGMTEDQYREYVMNKYYDPATNTWKGVWDEATKSYIVTDANGNKQYINMKGTGVTEGATPEQLENYAKDHPYYWDGTPEKPIDYGNSGNTGGTTTTQPSQPTTPPACNDAIPAGAYRSMNECGEAAEAIIDSYMDNGIFDKYTGYEINIGVTSCGTKYYTYTLY